MFQTSCDELVRQVGIYFDNKYLILASPEKQVTKNTNTKILYMNIFYEAIHFYILTDTHSLATLLGTI